MGNKYSEPGKEWIENSATFITHSYGAPHWVPSLGFRFGVILGRTEHKDPSCVGRDNYTQVGSRIEVDVLPCLAPDIEHPSRKMYHMGTLIDEAVGEILNETDLLERLERLCPDEVNVLALDAGRYWGTKPIEELARRIQPYGFFHPKTQDGGPFYAHIDGRKRIPIHGLRVHTDPNSFKKKRGPGESSSGLRQRAWWEFWS